MSEEKSLLEKIKSVRGRTFAPMGDCKKALMESSQDEEKAIDWLKKKGIASYAKRAGREASEGVAAFEIKDNAGVLLSLQCETDFVAKNEKFYSIAKFLATELLDKELEDIKIDSVSVSDYLMQQSSSLGENIKLGEVIKFDKKDNSYVYGYAHNKYAENVGRIATLVRVSKEDSEFGNNIALNIVGMGAQYLEFSDIPSEEKDRELEILKDSVASLDKSEEDKSKILQGKLEKKLRPSVLMDQVYVKDTKLTVRQYALQSSNEILEFKKISIKD
ncbi:translation elongation factor Ts [Candidatus Nesciobacter abundans]|uniref:Elongation factor Ts n=1 Tax=Candidatus Nesciobacter abundans TaxID=2601668 RepID=A0A5C0UHG2_9PROT|nr:translation elongation factor Ts [Candidatus Nesciobacter abundans]QEK39199.1 translation elongation factor Ts [Candidatus Nesciobacter abundans]